MMLPMWQRYERTVFQRTIIVGLLALLVTCLTGISAQENTQLSLPVVYISFPAGSPAQLYEDLHVINPDTGEIIFESTSAGRDCELATSPDGRWLLYRQAVIGDDAQRQSPRTMLVDLTNGHATEIDLDLQQGVHWLPQTNSFIYRDREQTSDGHILRQFNVDTDEISTIYRGDRFPRILRTDNALLYNFLDREPNTLEIYALDGTLRHTQANHPQNYRFSLSPDGHRIAFSISSEDAGTERGESFEQVDYYITDMTPNQPSHAVDYITISDAWRTEHSGGDLILNHDLAWHPDSNKVAYIDLNGNLAVYDLLTHEITLFGQDNIATTFSDWTLRLYWSPDGRYIAYWRYTGMMIDHDDACRWCFGVIDTVNTSHHFVDGYKLDSNSLYASSGFDEWINNQEFIYYTTIGDVLKYNVTTQTITNLTNSPDAYEIPHCEFG